MALVRRITLRLVAGKKRVPKPVHDDFKRVFEQWVKDNHDGNQTRAAKVLGITQSHVSALIKGIRGPGLDLLIKLRKRTSITIDQWLDLDPLPLAVSREEYEVLLAEIRKLAPKRKQA